MEMFQIDGFVRYIIVASSDQLLICSKLYFTTGRFFYCPSCLPQLSQDVWADTRFKCDKAASLGAAI